jgi:DNA-binding CsgD family transcriptional regulator
MLSTMHVDPNSPRETLTKRQRQVLERLERGETVKRIARDIGISRAAVYQHVERLRRQGAVAETYTPSGQPPRRSPDAAPAGMATAPRESNIGELRRLAAEGGGQAGYAAAIEGAIASADAVALAYELGRLDASGDSGLPFELVESALRRLSVLPSGGQDPSRR